MRAVAGLLFALFSIVACAAPPKPDYRVRVSSTDARDINVTFRYTVESQDLSMADWGAEHFPEGWGKFVSDVQAKDERGAPVALSGGPQAWKIAANKGQRVEVSYRLRLDHDRHPWPHGLDEAAYVKPDAVFLTGMALFLSPDDTAGATVRFELPPGWRASTPWNRNPDGSFGVPTGGELLSNVVMLGQHDERVFMQDGMRVTLAVGGTMKASAPMLESVMKPAVAAYARMFGGVPKSNYLVTLHEGLTDGGAFNRSYSMLAGMPLTRANLIDWGHIVAHETLHLWNGTGMRPKTQMDWFKEGFTDYLTILTLRRLDLIDEALFTKKLESHVRRTMGPKTLPLAEAGKDKKANWAWIYGGGAMAALALDAQLREATREQQNLETAMQRMFALHRDQPFELADLIRVTTAVAGSDTGSFFARHIAGMEPLPLKAAFARFGYELVANTQGEVFLVLSDEPSPAQRQAREAWLRAKK